MNHREDIVSYEKIIVTHELHAVKIVDCLVEIAVKPTNHYLLLNNQVTCVAIAPTGSTYLENPKAESSI